MFYFQESIKPGKNMKKDFDFVLDLSSIVSQRSMSLITLMLIV